MHAVFVFSFFFPAVGDHARRNAVSFSLELRDFRQSSP